MGYGRITGFAKKKQPAEAVVLLILNLNWLVGELPETRTHNQLTKSQYTVLSL